MSLGRGNSIKAGGLTQHRESSGTQIVGCGSSIKCWGKELGRRQAGCWRVSYIVNVMGRPDLFDVSLNNTYPRKE